MKVILCLIFADFRVSYIVLSWPSYMYTVFHGPFSIPFVPSHTVFHGLGLLAIPFVFFDLIFRGILVGCISCTFLTTMNALKYGIKATSVMSHHENDNNHK